MNVTTNLENRKHLRDSNSGSAPTRGPVDLSEERIAKIKSMSIDDLVLAIESHPEKLRDIHESILIAWKSQQTLTAAQLETLESYVLQHVPEIVADTMEYKEQTIEETN